MEGEYKVELVEAWTFLNAQRNPTDGYRITFRIAKSGSIDHIIVTRDEYSDKNTVQRLIKEAVARNLAIFGL